MDINQKAAHLLCAWYLILDGKVFSAPLRSMIPEEEWADLPDGAALRDEMRRAFRDAGLLSQQEQKEIAINALTMLGWTDRSNRDNSPGAIEKRVQYGPVYDYLKQLQGENLHCFLAMVEEASLNRDEGMPWNRVEMLKDFAGDEKAIRYGLIQQIYEQNRFRVEQFVHLRKDRSEYLTQQLNELKKNYRKNIFYVMDKINAVIDRIEKLPYFKQVFLYMCAKYIAAMESTAGIFDAMEDEDLPLLFLAVNEKVKYR